MTQEEKQLLLKDLSARLPYRVKGLHRGQVHIIANMDGGSLFPSIQVNGYCAWFPVETFKPYLRPMSSITEGEKEEFESVLGHYDENNNPYEDFNFGDDIDWFNAHHFDYRGLIEKGLALEAPKNMYKTD